MKRLTRNIIITTLGSLFILATMSAHAAIPAPSEIPNNIPAEKRMALQQQRSKLYKHRDALKAKINSHNSKCRSIKKDSPLVAECRQSQASLQNAISQYTAGVRNFNSAVIAASTSIPAPLKKKQELVQDALGFTGKWNKKDKQLVTDTLGEVKDSELRDWIATKAELNRFKANNFSPLTASGSTLRFKDSFFQESPARRVNLITFEAGKVFWDKVKDRRLADGTTLHSWFLAFSGRNQSVIGDMKVAKHKGVGFSGLGDTGEYSQFGYLFRAQALQLTRPTDGDSQQKWDSAMSEFRTRINPLLQENP